MTAMVTATMIVVVRATAIAIITTIVTVAAVVTAITTATMTGFLAFYPCKRHGKVRLTCRRG